MRKSTISVITVVTTTLVVVALVQFFEVPLFRKVHEWRFGTTIRSSGITSELLTGYFLMPKVPGSDEITIGGYYNQEKPLPTGSLIFVGPATTQSTLRKLYENAVNQKSNATFELVNAHVSCMTVNFATKLIRRCRNEERRVEIGFSGERARWDYFEPQFNKLLDSIN